ncbi:MAG: glycosyltransferase family 2 protein [Lachnospiraceae bacterium]|nr:glycosyltransferase family 2 protein [Lachnospiraceae bacterium]
MSNGKRLVIIPAYNEEETIRSTVADVREHAPGFDLVVVNDCSTDRTREICLTEGIPFLDLPVNLGIGGAVQTGYQYAASRGYQIAVQFDGDGQHRAEYLEEMARTLEEEGLDMVIGSRFIRHEGFQSSTLRQLGIRYFSGLIRLRTGAVITDPTSGMRMAGRRLIERFAADYPRDYPEPESVTAILKNGFRVEEIPVRMRERQGGVSSISLRKGIYYMIKVSVAVLLAK